MATREFWVQCPNDLMDLVRDCAEKEFNQAVIYNDQMFAIKFKSLEDAETLTWMVREQTGRLLSVVSVILGHI